MTATIVTHVDIYRTHHGKPDELIHSVPLDPPQDPDSRRLERIMGGLIRNMADDCYAAEREVPYEA